MNYKHYINGHFGGCVLLAKARDVYRDRDVQVFAIPGEFDHVGVTDGTDAWIAPVIADPFSCNIQRVLEEFRNGKTPVVEGSAPQPTPAPTCRVRKVINRQEVVEHQPVVQEKRIRRVISSAIPRTN